METSNADTLFCTDEGIPMITRDPRRPIESRGTSSRNEPAGRTTDEDGTSVGVVAHAEQPRDAARPPELPADLKARLADIVRRYEAGFRRLADR